MTLRPLVVPLLAAALLAGCSRAASPAAAPAPEGAPVGAKLLWPAPRDVPDRAAAAGLPMFKVMFE